VPIEPPAKTKPGPISASKLRAFKGAGSGISSTSHAGRQPGSGTAEAEAFFAFTASVERLKGLFPLAWNEISLEFSQYLT
jgi:hypothetical protein